LSVTFWRGTDTPVRHCVRLPINRKAAKNAEKKSESSVRATPAAAFYFFNVRGTLVPNLDLTTFSFRAILNHSIAEQYSRNAQGIAK